MAQVSDLINGTPLVPGVIPKLNFNNSVTDDMATRWIVSAVRNISDNYPFEELCQSGPLVPLNPPSTTGVPYVLPVSYFVNNSVRVTRFDSFMIQLDPSSGTSVELKWRTIKVVKALSCIQGMPIMYTIYGTQAQVPGSQQVYIAFAPSQTWNVQASCQVKHPFSDGEDDTILLPDAWLEVVANAAALIGADELRMADRMVMLQRVLYGDPLGQGEPGLIKKLLNARTQMGNVNERQITFVAGDH
jgi:hypothetical protein